MYDTSIAKKRQKDKSGILSRTYKLGKTQRVDRLRIFRQIVQWRHSTLHKIVHIISEAKKRMACQNTISDSLWWGTKLEENPRNMQIVSCHIGTYKPIIFLSPLTVPQKALQILNIDIGVQVSVRLVQ